MTHVITDLCLRDGACVEVCPVECIVAGQPEGEWPWYYIDPDTCIDCGACVPECPVEAIFPVEDVPKEYQPSTQFNADFFSKGPGYDALNM
jgi:ferredoxin